MVQLAVRGERLRVTAAGASHEVDAPSVELGALQLHRTVGGWSLRDTGTDNGLYLDGCRVAQLALAVGRPVELRVGAPDGPELVLEVLPVLADEPAGDPPPEPKAFPLAAGGMLRIGRAPTSDVVLDDALVSLHHAMLELRNPPLLRDLGSFNGTYVNGQRITATPLRRDDVVTVGSATYRWDGAGFRAYGDATERELVAERLTVTTESGRRLIDGVSFRLPSRSLTAVIGPSGSGKSTLLKALTGLKPATIGRVTWDGHDLYDHYEELRFQIGLVPQEDILHPQLTVRQGLGFAARLRLPPDTGPGEREGRVDQVMRQLGLAEQADHRIGTELSGGQRKRVSIATELLTAPPLLFLDEPTSGLDPGLDRAVMQQLRQLADEDRVVVVVTHSVLGLELCDTVVVMARGGRVAYVGPPDRMLEHFGCDGYPQLFDLLESPDGLRRLPRRSGDDRTPSRLSAALRHDVPPPRRSISRQLTTLMARNYAVLKADRFLLGMLLLMPLALALLGRVVQGDAGLSLAATRVGGGAASAAEASQRLTILVIGAALMGTAVTIRELVKERAVFRREYAVGLSPGVYFFSKVAVLGSACFLQGVVLTWLALAGLPGPDRGGVHGWGRLEIAVSIGFLAFTMAVVGLWVSALVRTVEQTMPALVGVVMVQVVLSSAIVSVSGRFVLEQLAWLAPARWAHAAAASSVNLERVKRGEAVADRDPLFAPTAAQFDQDLLCLFAAFSVACFLGLWALRRSLRD